jgi:hypothetical protein
VLETERAAVVRPVQGETEVTQDDKSWMLTFTKRKVKPLDFKPSDVDLEDIATSLAKQCRYNGHVEGFYSVAEHSVLLSRALERDDFPRITQFTGLLHDAAETYTGDIIRPLKNAMAQAGWSVKPYELQIEETISNHFGLPWPWPDVVHQYDTAIIRDEKDQLKFDPSDDWSSYGVPPVGLGVEIEGWDWKRARGEFIMRFGELNDR